MLERHLRTARAKQLFLVTGIRNVSAASWKRW
jgi:hypothetical protein